MKYRLWILLVFVMFIATGCVAVEPNCYVGKIPTSEGCKAE